MSTYQVTIHIPEGCAAQIEADPLQGVRYLVLTGVGLTEMRSIVAGVESSVVRAHDELLEMSKEGKR